MFKKSFWVLILAIFFTLSACSARKDNFKNRTYHSMTSWFNTLFNGQAAMDQKLEELEVSHQDDYFEVLTVEPYDEFLVNDNAEMISAPQELEGEGSNFMGRARGGNLLNNTNSTRSGFEKAEEKALKAIADHSMMIRGAEKNRLMSRAYLMLGQSRYYQGKPFQAMDALQQVQNLPFDKHDTEAKYYAALSQVQAGNKFAAAEILEKMYEDEELDKEMISNVAKQYAWLYFLENDYSSALNGLDKAIENTKNNKDEARLNFIQGQILTKIGRLDEANAKFRRAYKLKPGFEMEARSQVAIALNFDPMVNNYVDYRHQLMKAYKTGTYETYKNEFLYALGKIEEKRDSTQLAEKAYLSALKEEESSPRYRAETFAALGDLYFRNSDYVYAGAYYDSAVTAITEGKRKEEITKFRDNLKSVMDKFYLVQRNDSILRIANMSESEQADFFNKYIEELKIKDEEKRAVEEEQATEFLTLNKGNSFGNSFEENDGKFYFYSQTAKSNGANEFNRIWGNRQLKDGWRSSSTGTSIEDQKAELTGNTAMNDPRRYELDFYLEQIPTTEIALNDLKMERDTTELSLGLDYFDKFNDAKLSTKTLEHLVGTPPKEEEVLLKAYYNLYRINKDENFVVGERYKELVLNEFPNTIYAEYILNPQADYSEENSPEVMALYLETYEAYKENEFVKVQENVQIAVEQHSLTKIMAKFALLNAYAEAALNGEEKYIEALERILVLYPGTEEAKFAQSLLDKRKQNLNVENIDSEAIEKDANETETTKDNAEQKVERKRTKMDRQADRQKQFEMMQEGQTEIKK